MKFTIALIGLIGLNGWTQDYSQEHAKKAIELIASDSLLAQVMTSQEKNDLKKKYEDQIASKKEYVKRYVEIVYPTNDEEEQKRRDEAIEGISSVLSDQQMFGILKRLIYEDVKTSLTRKLIEQSSGENEQAMTLSRPPARGPAAVGMFFPRRHRRFLPGYSLGGALTVLLSGIGTVISGILIPTIGTDQFCASGLVEQTDRFECGTTQDCWRDCDDNNNFDYYNSYFDPGTDCWTHCQTSPRYCTDTYCVDPDNGLRYDLVVEQTQHYVPTVVATCLLAGIFVTAALEPAWRLAINKCRQCVRGRRSFRGPAFAAQGDSTAHQPVTDTMLASLNNEIASQGQLEQTIKNMLNAANSIEIVILDDSDEDTIRSEESSEYEDQKQ